MKMSLGDAVASGSEPWSEQAASASFACRHALRRSEWIKEGVDL